MGPSPEWMVQGKCRTAGVDMFPEDGPGARKAKAVCHTCPVKSECFDYVMALPVTTHGTWGETTHRDRRRIRASKQARPEWVTV